MTCAEEDNPQIQEYLRFFKEEAMDVYPIHLNPSHDVLLSRSLSPDRVNTHKISCTQKLGQMLSDMQFRPIQHPNTLSIDNSHLSPEQVSDRILSHIA